MIGGTRFGAVALVLLALGGGAAAQERGGFHLERFEPLPDVGLDVLNVSTSRILPSLHASAGLVIHYADDPLTAIRAAEAPTRLARLVDDRLAADVMVGFGLFDFASVGVALPVTLSASGDDLAPAGLPGASVAGAGAADVRIVTKVRFWYPEDTGGLGLHLVVPVWLPTGDPERFESDGAVRVQPTLGLDFRNADGFTLALNAGYHHRPERRANDLISGPELRWAVAIELPTTLDPLSVFGTIFGSLPLTKGRASAATDLRDPGDPARPLELLGGARVRFNHDVSLCLGGGAGLGGTIGAPTFRVFGAVGFTPTVSTRDVDDDGVPDVDDGCRQVPEDADGFEDDDGCPEDDNDGDGLPDDDDECPNAPEDADDHEDADGCPDPDNDGDGLRDADDACPDAPEDTDGHQDDDGCPDLDNDGDGLPDLKDRCPHEAEDVDGYQDGDGCVDPDNDKDGILDVNDRCPDFPETFNGLDDADGCPDTRSRYVSVYRDEIRLLREVYFERKKARLRPLSYPVLDDVADVLLSNAEITRVLIEGHTEDLGAPGRELRLSEARANAVKRYLVARGVDDHILETRGLGATRPIAPNDSAVGRAQNRRVEFKIVEILGRPLTGRGAAP